DTAKISAQDYSYPGITQVDEAAADLSGFAAKNVKETLQYAAVCGWLWESGGDMEGTISVPNFLIERAHAVLKAAGVDTDEIGNNGHWDPDNYSKVAGELAALITDAPQS
ncbi:MAG: hypothetical protein ACHQWH_02770, partial [Nitrososphaerales archaeon]